MRRRIVRLPMPLLLLAGLAAAMLIPAVFAVAHAEHAAARAFFYSGLLLLVLCAFAALALGEFRPRDADGFHLASLAAIYVLVPIPLGLPVLASAGGGVLTVWFEMVASITTTGASAYPPDSLPQAVHLWRGIVAWTGGLTVWVAAAAVLTPLNLGGEELITRGAVATGQHRQMRELTGAHHNSQIFRHLRLLFPIYAFLTVALWGILVSLGEHAYPALMRAMATMSTSGILAPGREAPAGGMGAELAVAAFLMFAVTQRLFRPEGMRSRIRRVAGDRELKSAVAMLAAILVLFLVGVAFHGSAGAGLVAIGRACLAVGLTALSFLTTAGMPSAALPQAQALIGGEGIAMMMIVLAAVGGGIGTTAGGVKLLRVYAMFKHGERELGRLIEPRSVAAGGAAGRRLRREGALVAWVFFMLFVLALAAVASVMALDGHAFEPALVLAVSLLSTTGPLAPFVLGDPAIYAGLDAAGRLIAIAAMVVGRLEVLALIALLNPDFWRR